MAEKGGMSRTGHLRLFAGRYCFRFRHLLQKRAPVIVFFYLAFYSQRYTFLSCKVYHRARINNTSISLPIISKGVPKREKKKKSKQKKRATTGDEKSLLGQPHPSGTLVAFVYRQNPYRSDDAAPRLEPAPRH